MHRCAMALRSDTPFAARLYLRRKLGVCPRIGGRPGNTGTGDATGG